MAALDMDRMRAQGKRFIDGFTPGQKAMTLFGVVAVVLASMTFMKWAGTPTYGTLYTGLASSDAAKVSDELNAQGVKFKLEDGGQTVMVPQKDVYRLRVALGGQGLPSGGHEGYPLLDKGGITQSEFSQRIDYQRAVQGELARTLEEIAGVSAARVTLTIPKDTVFVGGEADKPTAAVLVDTGGTKLASGPVQSIVNIVASSVADMSPDAVTVADAAGNMLHTPGQNGNLAAGEQLEQKAAFEGSLAKSLIDLIATSLGPGHAAVSVEARLNMSSGETHSTEFTQGPVQLPVRSTTSDESFIGTGDSPTGPLGPDGLPIAGGATPNTYSKSEADSEFALNTVERTINEAPGEIERFSVSVLLDSEAVEAAQVQQWTNALTVAAGIDPTTDAISVVRVPFATEAAEQAAKDLAAATGEASKTQLLDMVRTVVTFLIVGLVLFLAWRAIKKAEVNRIPLRVPLDLRELEAADMRLEPAPETQRLPEAAPRPALDPAQATVEHEVTDLIERQPDEVAQTLRSWLADRRA